jgi:hypothetical protein
LTAAPAACRRGSLPPRPAGSSVVVAADSPGDAGATLEEIEPNDLLANAQHLELGGTASLTVNGHLVAPLGARAKDVDLFRIVVAPPSVVVESPDGGPPSLHQLLNVAVTPEARLAIAVDALDDQGRILVTAAGSPPGEAEWIPNLSVIPGTYFVRVRPVVFAEQSPRKAGGAGPRPAAEGSGSAANPAGPGPGVGVGSGAGHAAGSSPGPAGGLLAPGTSGYQLVVRLAPEDRGDEVEPNGRSALANEVAAGGDVAGFLGWRHDEDWFRIPLAGLPEGSALSIDLDPVEGVAASVTVLDSVEQKMTEQKGRKEERVAIRNVRLPSSDPCVYVVVKAEQGRNPEIRYSLHLRTEEARADSELEPNDDVAHAVPLADGTFLGYLGPGDVDVYRYAAPLPVELAFEVVPPDHVDVKIDVLREDGSSLARIDSGRRREAERLPNLYVEGSVLLRLSAGKGDGNVDEPYRITASSRPVEPGAEREPNGVPAEATPLEAGVTGTGLIFPRGDTDFWRSNAAAKPGEQLAIAVKGIPGMTLEVRLVGVNGKEGARFRVGGEASAPLRISPPQGPGETCCLLQVRETTGRLANPRDRYSVSVTPVTP